ncbi:MAG TPA: class I SAM-dependent methyltransferase [Candidatus Sulfopaludibacter sp.]|nr:class I SAM-dependent methyltransferase [Candidatus Sulfopaludibacter sp.]
MNRLVDSLPPGARVLDMGARSGSFSTTRRDITVVRLDLEPPAGRKPGPYVAADAAGMPFAGGCFDAVISNHSLEHFLELEATVREIGRVVRQPGALYVAVPDAGTFSDRVYRWLGRGGGHVNPFRAPEEVIALIERLTPLRHRATVQLTASFSFLNSHNFTARPPRRIALFAYGNEPCLAILNAVLRRIDRVFGTRLSVYGWAFHFGEAAPAEMDGPWINVCVRCGAGASEVFLRKTGMVRGRTYRCGTCGGFNLLERDSGG